MDWLEINNKNGVGEILIYGYIKDEKWMEEDVTPIDIKRQLDELSDVETIEVYVNSGGGSVFAGIAIHSMLQRLNKPITTYVDGIAASIASVFILASDKVIIPKDAWIMIHNASGGVMGDVKKIKKYAETLERIQGSIVDIYKSKTGLSEVQILEMMGEETWMNGEEAVAFGFADELDESKKIAACYEGDIANFNGIDVNTEKFNSFPTDKIEKKSIEDPEIVKNNTEEQKKVLDFDEMVAQHEHNMKVFRNY